VKTKGICGREAHNIPGDVLSPYLAVTALTVLFSPLNGNAVMQFYSKYQGLHNSHFHVETNKPTY